MFQNANEAEYWTEQIAAHHLGLAPITLKIWRAKGKPVAPVYRFGRRVMYRAADVRAYADRQCDAQPNGGAR